MILNNQKIGKEVISKIIEMGEGDVNIGVFRNRAENYVGVSFNNREPSIIGTKTIDVGLTINEVTPDTMLTFFKEESIDVLIEKLKEAKIQFRNL